MDFLGFGFQDGRNVVVLQPLHLREHTADTRIECDCMLDL